MTNYKNLLAKIDALVAKIRSRHPASFECRKGCAECCIAGLTVCRVEFDNIQAQKVSRPASRVPRPGRCPFLSPKNLCTIYKSRPVVCRLWGSPMLFRTEDAARGFLERLKIEMSEGGFLTCCNKNFCKGTKLEDLPETDMIDVEKVLTTLSAINHVYCKERGLDPEERLNLADALKS
jgi:hypothetical protein